MPGESIITKDGALATTAGGASLVTDEGGAPCCCDHPAPVFYIRADPCANEPPDDQRVYVKEAATCGDGSSVVGAVIYYLGKCRVPSRDRGLFHKHGTYSARGSTELPADALVSEDNVFPCFPTCEDCANRGNYLLIVRCDGTVGPEYIIRAPTGQYENFGAFRLVGSDDIEGCKKPCYHVARRFAYLPEGQTVAEREFVAFPTCCDCGAASFYCGKRSITNCIGQHVDCGCCGQTLCKPDGSLIYIGANYSYGSECVYRFNGGDTYRRVVSYSSRCYGTDGSNNTPCGRGTDTLYRNDEIVFSNNYDDLGTWCGHQGPALAVEGFPQYNTGQILFCNSPTLPDGSGTATCQTNCTDSLVISGGSMVFTPPETAPIGFDPCSQAPLGTWTCRAEWHMHYGVDRMCGQGQAPTAPITFPTGTGCGGCGGNLKRTEI